MCGINGIINKNKIEKSLVDKQLALMNNEIVHRGPDDEGYFLNCLDSYSIGMAMRRLSIIDLSTGKQPIYSEDNQKVIVFNGEIYNYKSLKETLIMGGAVFTTKSDTEVILKLYEKYGAKSFSMLDGMFAFSIFDKTLNKVFIARDFFGEKPLYYCQDFNNFFWASELKSVIRVLPNKPEISREAINIYFQLTYIPSPFTIYEGISKLEPNHFLEFDCLNFTFNVKKIDQQFESIDGLSTLKSATQKTHDLVLKSVQSRTVSDVPIGTFLSGGVDSSIISLSLSQQTNSKIDTFSIGFEKAAFDESEKARTVARLIDSNHHEFIVGEKDLTNNLEEILNTFDEPFADSSALATFLVASKTANYVKVALTGDGGDEVFGGYNKYHMGAVNSRYTNLVPKVLHSSFQNLVGQFTSSRDDNRGLAFKLNRMMKAVNYDNDFYYNIISLGFQEDELGRLFKPQFYKERSLNYFKFKISQETKSLTDFRNVDLHLSLEGDMLVKVDRTSMLASLECRAPFLNKELWNFTNQLPENYLIKGWNKKFILKKAFEQYFPKGFLDKSKKGFGVPVGDWLRAGLKDELLALTERSFIEKQNIFNFSNVEKTVKNHIDGKTDNTFRVWTFYCFQKWYKNAYFF
jgi:asparagine synthase (glutamine-hydrolysing)